MTPAAKIFQVTQTAEQLAVTLYSRGVQNGLGLEDDDLDYFKAAAIHEQIHQRFFASLTGRGRPADDALQLPRRRR